MKDRMDAVETGAKGFVLGWNKALEEVEKIIDEEKKEILDTEPEFKEHIKNISYMADGALIVLSNVKAKIKELEGKK